MTFLEARRFVKRNHGGDEEQMLALLDAVEGGLGVSSMRDAALRSPVRPSREDPTGDQERAASSPLRDGENSWDCSFEPPRRRCSGCGKAYCECHYPKAAGVPSPPPNLEKPQMAAPLTGDEIYAITRLLETYTHPLVTGLQVRLGEQRLSSTITAATSVAVSEVEDKHRVEFVPARHYRRICEVASDNLARAEAAESKGNYILDSLVILR